MVHFGYFEHLEQLLRLGILASNIKNGLVNGPVIVLYLYFAIESAQFHFLDSSHTGVK